MAAATTRSSSNPNPRSALPLFYRRLVPVAPETFRGKSLDPAASREFARRTSVVPLNAGEFALAQHHYPIVFAGAGQRHPLAVVGLRKHENLFLGDYGRWDAATYVPAYIRRFPFMLMRTPGATQFLLGVDMESAFVVDGNANPFFKDGKPAEAVNRAAAFCRDYQAETEKTDAFCAGLAEHGLLRPKTVELAHPSGQRIKLGQLHVVDESKFAALLDAIVDDWHRRGWLAHVHAHLFSLANWQRLASRLPPT